tara:strand:- start:139 stop:270 length:132 start_codon:yes stop_codon:yes gene_type:complete
VEAAIAEPTLPKRFTYTNKVFFNLAIAFRADVLVFWHNVLTEK